MYVIAICGPLESKVREFAKKFKQQAHYPVTIIDESDYQKTGVMDYERLKVDLEKEKKCVLLVGHHFYTGNALKKLLGEKLKIQLFLETAPDSCLANFLHGKSIENLQKNLDEYDKKIKPVNDCINRTIRYADVVIPERGDHSVTFALLNSTLAATYSQETTKKIMASMAKKSHMILFSSVLGEHKLTFTKLSKCLNHLTVAAIWAETEWGYIRNKGIESRKKILLDMSESVYVGTLADKPVAMFALVEQESLPIKEEWEKLPAVRQLMYVYVEKNYRGLGFGQQILKEAKKQATLLGADLILLDTLKPGLNRMYMKEGAEFVCENQLFSHPTDVLKMTL